MNEPNPSPARRVASLLPGSPLPATIQPVTVTQSPTVTQPLTAIQPVAASANAVREPDAAQEKTCESRRFRRSMNIAGFSLVTTPLLQLLLSSALSYGVLLYAQLFQKMGGVRMNLLLTAIVYPLSFLAPLLILRGVSGVKCRELFSLRRPRALYMTAAAPITLGLNVVGLLLGMLLSRLTAAFGVVSTDETLQPASFGFWDLTLYFVVLAVLPAILEELLFRGALLTLLRRYGDGFAVVTTAAAFALMHGNLEQTPTAFMVGLALGLVTVRSGSVWPAVLAHFVNNGLPVILGVAFAGVSGDLAMLVALIEETVFVLAALLAVWLLARRDRDAFRLRPADTAVTGVRRLGLLCTAPGSLLYVFVCGVLMCASFTKVY